MENPNLKTKVARTARAYSLRNELNALLSDFFFVEQGMMPPAIQEMIAIVTILLCTSLLESAVTSSKFPFPWFFNMWVVVVLCIVITIISFFFCKPKKSNRMGESQVPIFTQLIPVQYERSWVKSNLFPFVCCVLFLNVFEFPFF